MTRRLAQQFIIVVCALALMIVPLASIAPTSASNEPSGSFHWGRKPSQFTVQAGNNVSGNWDSLLRTAISQWNKGDAVTIKEVSGGTNAQNCNERTGRIEVCSGMYGTQVGWLGLTRLFFNRGGDHVEAATVQMNNSFFDQRDGQYNDDDARRHTICHEMGHAIGLGHVDSKSCMNNSQYAVFHYIKPINKDYRHLERIYRHKDSTTTVDGKQKKDKKDKKDRKGKKDRKHKKDRKGKKHRDRDRKQSDKDERRERRERKRERRRDARSDSFFDPTSLPAVPSGLEGDETVTVENLEDGRTVVSFITWAEE